MTQPPPWKAVKPFMSESQMRALVAIHNGCRSQQAVADALHRNIWTIRTQVFPRLKQWGLIRYATTAREWHLSRSWEETLEEIKKRVRWHMEQMCLAVDDFRDPPPLGSEAHPDGA